jgi:hypothetical protein
MTRLLRIVLLVHGAITLAGAVVMTVLPTAIPSAVGITLDGSAYLLVYLVAAAELAAAVLSVGAALLTDPAALRLVVVTLAVMHGASGALTVLYMVHNAANGVLLANTCARLVAVAVLLGAWRTSVRRIHQT